MKIVITSRFNLSAEDAWSRVKQSETLVYVCKGLLGFDTHVFPDQWQQGEEITTRLYLFNLIPAWRHTLYFKKIDDARQQQFTEEQGGLVKRWNHLISIEAVADGTCRYSDELDINAGIFTPLVSLFASILYRYRQRRWKKMIRKRSTITSS